ncbi:exosome complex exonuclease RRP42-like isoform X2 [Varroa jacobsoni]|uniref:Ribosomal RNA-processing protein 42 n=1 Tax=Varroa destructor TaxID=109461 RepID=A0A7M7K0P5_VARDE|nr:exosome complex exonuclease RRP42-like isoform X2 [Varroa destructor]XP_022696502.1 exosome complex exonuclease RRP42-like isoform X2 [Varroa jacobsoni]
MATTLLSDSERIFIIHGVEDNLRCDGRSCLEYRHIEMELGAAPNCSGSSHVRIANTDVLVGIKVNYSRSRAEIGAPEPSAPDSGRIEFFVDFTANADPEFEGSGGDDLGQQIAGALSEAYVSKRFLDLSSLCIVSGQQVWTLYVDVLILELGGSLYDAVSVAVKAALRDLRIPRLSVSIGEDGRPEIEVSDDPHAVDPLEMGLVPCFVTLSKIGSQFVVDVSQEEAECTTVHLCCAVAPNGRIATTMKNGVGSLHTHNLIEALQLAQEIGVALHKALDKRLVKAQELSGRTNGFLL